MAPVGGAPPVVGLGNWMADWELVTDMTGYQRRPNMAGIAGMPKKKQCCGPGKWLRLFDATIWYFHDLLWQRESSG